MMGRKQEVVQAREEMEEKMGRKLSQDSGVDDDIDGGECQDDIDGGECQEIADLFQEQKIAEEVTPFGSRTNSIGSRATSSCSSLLSGGEDARTLELDIFTMCR